MNRRMIVVTALAVLTLSSCSSDFGAGLFDDSASASQGSISSPSASSVSSPESTYTPIESQSFSGTGDDVVSLGDLTDPAILTFHCSGCTGNTTVKTDGREGLLVNVIGPYSGSHFINLHDNSMTTQVVIGADSSWLLDIDDFTTAMDVTSGSGDTALLLQEDATKATITNRGEGNFVVWVYSLSGNSDLAVNEIGSYHGTVPFDAPALVQVESDGSWEIQLS